MASLILWQSPKNKNDLSHRGWQEVEKKDEIFIWSV